MIELVAFTGLGLTTLLGGTAAAGATAGVSSGLFAGLGLLTTALSVGAQLFSGISANAAASKQAAFERQRMALQSQQYDLEIQAEQTQAAVENEQRQRQLRRTLATQNAILGMGNVDLGSTSASVIAGDTYDEAARQQNQATLFSDTRTSVIGLQRADNRIAGEANISAIKSRGRNALIGSFFNAGSSLLNFAARRSMIGST